jgi:DNA-binding MarR family transcriptional regulator
MKDHPSLPGMVFHALNRAQHKAIQEKLATHGLQEIGSPLMLMLLRRRNREGVLPAQRELADSLSISPATVAASLKSLERQGFVERETDTRDARRNIITITPKGVAAVEQCHTVFRKLDAQMFSGFTEEEIHLLDQFHQRMLDNLLSRNKKEETHSSC